MAMTSLIVIIAAYAVSLCSELVCNSKPLFVKTSGKCYFPFAQHVSSNELFGDGVLTAPDYAKVDWSSFSGTVVRAPFRFGPRDIVAAESLDAFRRVRVTVRPEIRAARFDVRSDLTVFKYSGSGIFAEGTANGQTLTNLFAVSNDLLAALEGRFANAKAPAFAETVASATGVETELSLLDYEPRSAAPRSVRVRLRDAAAAKAVPASLVFTRNGEETAPTRASHVVLERMDATMKEAVLSAVASVSRGTDGGGATDGASARIEGPSGSTIVCELEAVAWPYRPVKGHPMGIDSAGRDVLARILYGTRTAMTFGLVLVIWSILIGIIAGAVQGYFGGWVDLAGQRFIEIWSSLPFLYVMILVGSVFGRSFGLLLFCYGLFNWIGVSYYVRAEFLRLRKRPFVEAAKCQGLGAWRIIWRHILPNALTPVITLLPFNLVGAIASISALDFLGFGLPPLTPSWGELLQQAQQDASAWWLILYPSLMLFASMLLTVFVGEGLRDAFDPKPNSRYR